MLKTFGIAAIVGAFVATTGCLQKETTHTLYLAPDGSVNWVTSEVGVHSDDAEPGKRIAEEQQYIGAALLGTHRVAAGLAALGSQDVHTTVLRDQRPFHVVTSAHFQAIDRVMERLFGEVGVKTSASLVQAVDQITLRVRLDFSRGLDERDTALSDLVDLEHLRFTLTDGRFITATGFDITGGMSAVLSHDWMERAERAGEARSSIEFVLSWTVG